MPAKKILTALRTLFSDESIHLHEPHFCGREWEYIKQCLDSRNVSSSGDFVKRFEDQLCQYTGVKGAVGVVNGTSGLHIALKLCGVEANDEVLVPDLTFIATANAVTYCGAIPHFIDSDEKTLGVDPYKLKEWLNKIVTIKNKTSFNKITGRRMKALMAVHVFGHPVDLDPILEVCNQYYLDLIEDAAGALGSFYKGRHVGQWGKFGVISFNGNKTITTGGGGVILSNDEKMTQLAKHITTTAKLNHPWLFYHDQVGYNYRLPNMNAALGCAQMESLPFFLEKKRNLALKYRDIFSDIEDVIYFLEPAFAKSNYWLNALLFDSSKTQERDILLEMAYRAGIKLRPIWTLLHKQPMYSSCPRMNVSVAEGLEARLVNLPSSAYLL